MNEQIQCHSCGYFFCPNKQNHVYCGYCYIHYVLVKIS